MSELYFQQLFESESSTYTYLLADVDAREAILIDTVLEKVDRDESLLRELGFQLKYVLDTHVHADHITGSGTLRKRSIASQGAGHAAKVAISAAAGLKCADIQLHDGDVLKFGRFEIKALTTPGHTDTCMSFVCEGRVFTGDALLIRGTGRTDFQQGSSATLFSSLREKIFTLPDSTQIFPGHDYKGFSFSTVAQEKKFNPRVGLSKTLPEFEKIMAELKLANPKRIHEAVPANLLCGLVE